ncbi:MAG TPA: Rieske (2Fe-2S) protein, partial [Acidimicrobiales bacterium]|nr:Rieske (2Fe-2S) protein [Acidimicrobiales bacterium]
MQREVALALMRRAVNIAENQWPEMADAHMEVPLNYFTDAEVAAKERELFETFPLALIASSEIAHPNDYLVRNAVGRSILLTRDEDGVAHAFLNYCRHRGAEPAQGCGNARRFSCPYHAWVYDTKGQLVGMPLRDRHDGLEL